jgi:hypothetical protein
MRFEVFSCDTRKIVSIFDDLPKVLNINQNVIVIDYKLHRHMHVSKIFPEMAGGWHHSDLPEVLLTGTLEMPHQDYMDRPRVEVVSSLQSIRCCLCGEKIRTKQLYYEGGHGKRSHYIPCGTKND